MALKKNGFVNYQNVDLWILARLNVVYCQVAIGSLQIIVSETPSKNMHSSRWEFAKKIDAVYLG